MKRYITFITLFIIKLTVAQPVVDSNYIWGVTLDDISSLSGITAALSQHCKKPTARIVFDAGQSPSYYSSAISAIHNVAFIMGEPVDSYYDTLYTVPGFINQTAAFLNAFGSTVDIWEIGNEVNGRWNRVPDTVAAQIKGAYNLVKLQGKKAALTLYYDDPCDSNTTYMMFPWIAKHITDSMKKGLDYVFISYYEQDCNNVYPGNWQQIFDSLHTIFPNAKVGFGEIGVDAPADQGPNTDVAGKGAYMRRYYNNLNATITLPAYVGGYFWWYYREECVPSTYPLWDSLNNNFGCTTVSPVFNPEKPEIFIQTIPNPTCRNSTLLANVTVSGNYSIALTDVTGRNIYRRVLYLAANTNQKIILPLEHFGNGIYILKVGTNTSILKALKIVKE